MDYSGYTEIHLPGVDNNVCQWCCAPLGAAGRTRRPVAVTRYKGRREVYLAVFCGGDQCKAQYLLGVINNVRLGRERREHDVQPADLA